MPNESLDLAVEYVLTAIAAYLDGDEATPGTRVEVEHLEDCDCVPVEVDDGTRVWDLVGVRQIVRGGESNLRASYEAR